MGSSDFTRTEPSRGEAPIRVVIFAPLFPPALFGGGPIRSLEALVSSLSAPFEVSVLAGDREARSVERMPVESNEWSKFKGSAVYYVSANNPLYLAVGLLRLRRTKPHVIYVNSFFDARLSIIPQILWRFFFWGRAERLVAPRGEFGTSAFARRKLKKTAFVLAYRFLGLHTRVYWHASSENEAKDIRRVWGERAKILVREDETSLPALATPPVETAKPRTALRAAFLGRIVEHKGLLIILEALRELKVPMTLSVYGPEEDASYAAKCRLAAEVLAFDITVVFLGPIPPGDVRTALHDHDVLLMPTAGENFGHVIAEALSVSCPVLCTPYTPWTETLAHGGGQIVEDRTVGSWRQALDRYARYDESERLDRRRCAEVSYNNWKVATAGAHVFELLEEAREGRAAM